MTLIVWLNEVSKMCGIKTVELQHGIINREHIAYNYPSCVSVNQFPDYFFVWSDFWKNRVKCPILENRIIATGFPYLEKQIRKYAKKRIQKSEKKVVLFLSQGNIGRHLAQIAIGVYKVLDRNKYHIIFKLHPDEFVSWKNQFPELAECSDIEIIDNGKQNLYELFAKSDVQVGCFSTAIYEGLI